MTAVYLVVGVKGGTGATTLCVDLARAARRVKRSVTVVDADLGGHRNVAELLDATRLLNANRGGSIFSVARSGDIDVVELVDKYDDSFALRRKDVDTLAADVSTQGDLVLVDAPRPFEGNVFPFATRSQRVLLVMEPDHLGAASSRTMLRDLVRFGPTNFADVARVFGLRGIRVEDPSQIQPALKDALASDETVIVDVATDIDCRAPEPWLPAA